MKGMMVAVAEVGAHETVLQTEEVKMWVVVKIVVPFVVP